MNDTCLSQFVYESIPAGRKKKIISTNEKEEQPASMTTGKVQIDLYPLTSIVDVLCYKICL